MDSKKATIGVITIAVAIIMVATLTVPVINDAIDKTEHITKTNVVGGATNMAYSILEEDATIRYDGSTLTINGTNYTGRSVYAFSSDSCFLYFDGSGVPKLFYVSGTTYTRIQNITAFDAAIDPAAKTITMTYSTATDSDVPLSFTYSDWAAVLDSAGDHRIIDCNAVAVTVYVNDISEIYALQYSGGDLFISSIGDVCRINGSTEGVTTTLTSSPLTGSDGKIITATIGGTSGGLTFAYGSSTYIPHVVIVPAEVIAYAGSNSGLVVLYGVIPAMILVGVLAFAIATFIRSRA